MARLFVTQGPCSAVLPTVHGCHYAFQKFPFFCITCTWRLCLWLTRSSPYKSLCYGHMPTIARRMAEWILGIYCRIFHRPIDVKPDSSDIIKACCILQNYVRKNDCIQFDDTSYECPLEIVQPVGIRGSVRGTESISLRHKHQFPGSMVNCSICFLPSLTFLSWK